MTTALDFDLNLGKLLQVRDSTVDVMRLSIIVRNNLEKDGEGSEYHAASSSGAPSGDIKLNHTDAELDFEEQSPDAAGEGRSFEQTSSGLRKLPISMLTCCSMRR